MTDPVAIGTLVASALAMAAPEALKTALGEAVKDGYKALKEKLWLCAAAEIASLEAAPASKGKQLAVAEIIDTLPDDDSIVASRDPLTQAIFTLRGKPLNVFGMKLDQLYKNEEMFNLMNALNIEDDIEQLRYNKVVLATDADVDGMHIRNLLITFFLTYFEGLVLNGHLFILETPLFKVRNKEQTFYCYTEEERDKAIAKLKKGVEVTRFKGLGEISPHEFKQFIGKDIRLINVTINSFSDIKPTLQFYMGKNTPERKQFIMQNLVNEEELKIAAMEE